MVSSVPVAIRHYVCVEEGILYADDRPSGELNTIQQYARSRNSEVISHQFDERLHIYGRSEFAEKILFETVRNRGLIVAFNAPWDISRLAVDDKVSRNRGWTLILSQRTSRKTSEIQPNPERPFIRATSKDSKACFFSSRSRVTPKSGPTMKLEARHA